MADSGFGIFSVAYHATQAEHEILFRLTDSRYKSLCKKAKLIDDGPHHQSHTLTWQPSAKDRKGNPNLPDDAAIEIAIHKVALDNGKFLYLATTLEMGKCCKRKCKTSRRKRGTTPYNGAKVDGVGLAPSAH